MDRHLENARGSDVPWRLADIVLVQRAALSPCLLPATHPHMPLLPPTFLGQKVPGGPAGPARPYKKHYGREMVQVAPGLQTNTN